MDLMLKGIRVLDFTNNTAGPVTVALMAERGAEALKIEKPVIGDDCRLFAPSFDGVSSAHMWVNRNKKSVVLNLKDERAKKAILELVKTADVLVESYRPGVMEKLGYGYEELSKVNPKLIYCSISGFGSKGPYKDRGGYDIIAQGFSGIMDATGDRDGHPNVIGFHIGDTVSAINAFGSIMMALYYRTVSGKGQFIDISLARTLIWNTEIVNGAVTGKFLTRSGNHSPFWWPFGAYEGNNGESLLIAGVADSIRTKICEIIGREELANDPKYKSTGSQIQNMEVIVDAIETWLKKQPSIKAAEEQLLAAGIPCTKVNSQEDVYKDEHVRECNWLQDIPVTEGVTSIDHIVAGVGLADFSEGSVLNGSAPSLGEHNQEILQECGFTEEEIDQMEAEWAAPRNRK